MVNDSLPARNRLWFRKFLIKQIWKTSHDTENIIRDERVRYKHNRKAATMPALSFGESGKYKYLTGEDITSWVK